MNFNISNNIKLAPFLTPNHGNKLPEGQLWFLIISTALKQSLSFYSLEWKPTQNSPNNAIQRKGQSGMILQSNESYSKKVEEKQLKQVQQNKKSVQKISYNSKIQKNDKKEERNERNEMITEEKRCYDEQKELKTQCEDSEKNKQKIIHQNQTKQSKGHRNKLFDEKVIIDFNDAADIPQNNLSSNEIEQKRQKLLLRKVVNWKEIDKRVTFRKMQLKKLLG